jgi:hypothetical protein
VVVSPNDVAITKIASFEALIYPVIDPVSFSLREVDLSCDSNKNVMGYNLMEDILLLCLNV